MDSANFIIFIQISNDLADLLCRLLSFVGRVAVVVRLQFDLTCFLVPPRSCSLSLGVFSLQNHNFPIRREKSILVFRRATPLSFELLRLETEHFFILSVRSEPLFEAHFQR